MKTIENLNDAITILLRGLFDAEKVLQQAIKECSTKATSTALRDELQHYGEDAEDKMLKLERIFNYLMAIPTGKRNYILRKMIEETREIMRVTKDDSIRDILLVSCVQSISNYKISGYQTALAIALDLGLEKVPDLLQEILEREIETEFTLNKLCKEILYQKQQQEAHNLID